MLSDKEIREIEELLQQTTLSDDPVRAFPPGQAHTRIMEALDDVSTKSGVATPRVLIHDGGIEGTAYLPDYDCLVIAEKLTDLLTDDEIKAILAHELDHKSRVHVVKRLQYTVSGLNQTQPYSSTAQRATSIAGRIMSHLELRADRRGANLYGPEQMEAALKKMVAHSTNPLAIAAVLGRIPQGDPRKEIFAALENAASGTSTIPDAELGQRLRMLRGRQSPQRTR